MLASWIWLFIVHRTYKISVSGVYLSWMGSSDAWLDDSETANMRPWPSRIQAMTTNLSQ